MLRSIVIISLSAALVAGLEMEQKLKVFCQLTGGHAAVGTACEGRPETKEDCAAVKGSFNTWCKENSTECFTPPSNFPPLCFVGRPFYQEEKQWIDQVFEVLKDFTMIFSSPDFLIASPSAEPASEAGPEAAAEPASEAAPEAAAEPASEAIAEAAAAAARRRRMRRRMRRN